MTGGKEKVDKSKKDNLYTYPLISDGNLKEVHLTIIQEAILKGIAHYGHKFTIRGLAKKLHCSTTNIRYHLQRLIDFNLLKCDSEYICHSVITNEGLQVLRGGKDRRLTKKLKVDQKGLLLQKRVGVQQGLTNSEKQIYDLTVNQFNSPLMIQQKLNCSKQYVYKVLRNLKKKGYLGGGKEKVDFLDVCSKPLSPPRYRFHNMRWTIKILKKLKNHKGKEQYILDGNKIKVWEHAIEIYSKKDFWGDTPKDAYAEAMNYWYKIFVQIEHRNHVEIVKDDTVNIELTKCELARANDELAKHYIKQGKKFIVYDSNNEPRFTIDHSHGLFEFEAIRSKSVVPDMEKAVQILTQYVEEPNLMTPKEMQKKIEFIIEVIGNSAIIQNNMLKTISELQKQK